MRSNLTLALTVTVTLTLTLTRCSPSAEGRGSRRMCAARALTLALAPTPTLTLNLSLNLNPNPNQVRSLRPARESLWAAIRPLLQSVAAPPSRPRGAFYYLLPLPGSPVPRDRLPYLPHTSPISPQYLPRISQPA